MDNIRRPVTKREFSEGAIRILLNILYNNIKNNLKTLYYNNMYSMVMNGSAKGKLYYLKFNLFLVLTFQNFYIGCSKRMPYWLNWIERKTSNSTFRKARGKEMIS